MSLALDLARTSALVFPPGGAHWPGMGADLEERDALRPLLGRAEEALARLGVPRGALPRLMRGEEQASRQLGPAGWTWQGDFPLSVAAQTIVGAALAQSFVELYGPPAVVAGESMGEIAACCAACSLEIEDAVILAYRWARAYQQASDALGLRMVVVEHLALAELGQLGAPYAARVVVQEAPHLHVIALPRSELGAFEQAVIQAGGRALVSNNPCAAHDARLREAEAIWTEHTRFIEELTLSSPVVPLLSTLAPPQRLASSEAVRHNLLQASFTTVRWSETMLALPAFGVRNLFQLGPASRPYALEKLRNEEPALADVLIKSLKNMAGVERRGVIAERRARQGSAGEPDA